MPSRADSELPADRLLALTAASTGSCSTLALVMPASGGRRVSSQLWILCLRSPLPRFDKGGLSKPPLSNTTRKGFAQGKVARMRERCSMTCMKMTAPVREKFQLGEARALWMKRSRARVGGIMLSMCWWRRLFTCKPGVEEAKAMPRERGGRRGKEFLDRVRVGVSTYIHRTEKAARTVHLSARCICRRQTMCRARMMLHVSSTSIATDTPALKANCVPSPPTAEGGGGGGGQFH